MKIISAFAIIGSAISVAWTRYKLQLWERAIHALENDIVNADPIDALTSKQSWNDLPVVVQRYLSKAILHPAGQDTIPQIQIIRFSQTGFFLMDPDYEWTAFTAEQFFSANPPGFVWDASVALLPKFQRWPMIQVCDVWAQGKAGIKLALLNVWEIPDLLQAGNEEEQVVLDKGIELGEAMRWLAESFLIPTSLLPDQGIVHWSPVLLPDGTEDTSKASIRLSDSLELPEALLIVTFNETTGLPIQLEGDRPKWIPASKGFEMVRWRGQFEEFQTTTINDGDITLYVPTHMKVGWINPKTDDLELYFDGYNHDLTFSGIKQKVSSPSLVHEEVIISATAA